MQTILAGLAVKSIITAIASIFTGSAVLGPVGLIAAGVGTAALMGYIASAKTVGDMYSPADGKTQISTKEGGLFELSPNDDLIAAPGLKGKMNKASSSSDMSRVEALLSQLIQKQDRPINLSVEMDGEKVAKGVGKHANGFYTQAGANVHQIS